MEGQVRITNCFKIDLNSEFVFFAKYDEVNKKRLPEFWQP